MLTWFRRMRQTSRPRPLVRRLTSRPMLESLEQRDLMDAGMAGFMQTALASDIRGIAAHTDADLINPWGFSETSQGQFRISSNGAGNAPLLNAFGSELGQAPVLQPPLGSPSGTTTTPNGNVANATSDFVISDDGKSAPASVIFSTEDGTLIGFNPKVDPKEGLLVAQSTDGAVYKLLAEASNAKGNFLFATDFHNNKIDVFDKDFNKVALGQNGWGTFTDPTAPAGFAPFGIKEVNGVFFVSYAKQDAAGHDDVAGAGNGFIDEFDTTGHFIERFASGSAAGGTAPLDSPIGMTVAPPGFGPDGKFGGALLVGNFGDSHVSAFNLKTGQFLGQLSDAQGNPLTLNGGVGGSGTKGLWGIAFGNGQGNADPNTLYFAAGINAEADGLFGKVTMPHNDPDTGGQGMNGTGDGGNHGNPQQDPGTPNLFANLQAALQSLIQRVETEVQQIESQIATDMQMVSESSLAMQGMMPSMAANTNMDAMSQQQTIDRVFSSFAATPAG